MPLQTYKRCPVHFIETPSIHHIMECLGDIAIDKLGCHEFRMDTLENPEGRRTKRPKLVTRKDFHRFVADGDQVLSTLSK
jgi:hypothetical protein